MSTAKLANFLGSLWCGNMVVIMYTDWYDGRYDPVGHYPRISDKDKIKKEMEFAEEFKKLTNYKPPQPLFNENQR